MVSKEVLRYIEEIGVDKLYKKHQKYFDLIDLWADKMIEGDILDENELCQCMEQMNGCQTKLNSVAGALESILIEKENNEIVKEESKFENLRMQDQNSCKAKARKAVSDIRRYASDFIRYTYSASNTVTVAQSRLKRLIVEKGNKKIGYSGEQLNES